MRRVLLAYVQALATQIAQTAICNRHHTIEQQLCSFLLHSLDRLRGGEVVVTQERIAGMLGVRRESVTAAAGQLRQAGLLHCARGRIAVRDRAGLERRSCECDAVVKREYDRLLPREPTGALHLQQTGQRSGGGQFRATDDHRVYPYGSAAPAQVGSRDLRRPHRARSRPRLRR